MRDMEQLADMVLNGDGQFLIGTKSDQPEIQAFLDNVPVYMVCVKQLFCSSETLSDLNCVLFFV